MSHPTFRYHPDPVATGIVAPELDAPCDVCGTVRGQQYTGPVYTVHDEPTVCLECVASGRAANALDCQFTDLRGQGWRRLPDVVRDEILHRTPGFEGWQQEGWLAHCGDGMAFLGPVGISELNARGPEATDAVRSSLLADGVDPEQADQLMRDLTRDASPSGYLFRCLHCDQWDAYVDAI